MIGAASRADGAALDAIALGAGMLRDVVIEDTK
jgi:hypothetical protein